ncbi:hypothetical protein BMF94_5694 [Rhodotorula taiwanensis]|uniref:Uncharacterized protein n=1 Tax=Rhodotorula taiwanensis TaxID=741276 RepID=A0A2S5B3L8_9BASI|nr:hypothetical protein BMF94_5694 [Rhodotorula taiwanensis]
MLYGQPSQRLARLRTIRRASAESAFPAPIRQRHFSSTRPSANLQERTYYYDVDVHGQLLLSAAKHRNVATAYRDVRFLDTFYMRMRRNDGIDSEEAQAARRLGYEYVSECMGEMNYVRPDRNG